MNLVRERCHKRGREHVRGRLKKAHTRDAASAASAAAITNEVARCLLIENKKLFNHKWKRLMTISRSKPIRFKQTKKN